LKSATREAVLNLKTKIAANGETKLFWHYVHSKHKSKATVGPLVSNTKGDLTTTPTECAQVLANFFFGVFVREKEGGSILKQQQCRLFQMNLEMGYVPLQWKVAHVTPIFKKDNKKEPGNYCLVSFTSCVSKLIELFLKISHVGFLDGTRITPFLTVWIFTEFLLHLTVVKFFGGYNNLCGFRRSC